MEQCLAGILHPRSAVVYQQRHYPERLCQLQCRPPSQHGEYPFQRHCWCVEAARC